MIEMLGSGHELRAAVDAVVGDEKLIGIVSAEIGGTNGVEPALVAAQLNVPLSKIHYLRF